MGNNEQKTYVVVPSWHWSSSVLKKYQTYTQNVIEIILTIFLYFQDDVQ